MSRATKKKCQRFVRKEFYAADHYIAEKVNIITVSDGDFYQKGKIFLFTQIWVTFHFMQLDNISCISKKKRKIYSDSRDIFSRNMIKQKKNPMKRNSLLFVHIFVLCIESILYGFQKKIDERKSYFWFWRVEHTKKRKKWENILLTYQ